MLSSSPGAILALAFPDRVAKNRGPGSFLLVNGRGAVMDEAAPLARASYLAVGEMTGSAAKARILLAASLDAETIAELFSERIESRTESSFDTAAMAVRARKVRRYEAITLGDAPVPVAPSPETARLLADSILAVGIDCLPWSKAALQLRERVAFLRAAGDASWPDLSDTGLKATADDWLLPLLADKTALRDIAADDLAQAISALLPWDVRARLDRDAPTHYEAPTGTRVAIDYAAAQGPTISIRLQELFGLSTHPSVAGGRVPLVLELLSPAQRPVQVTRDLPGFWRGSYAAVRADLRGRYPRHPWPEDPAAAAPTRRVKPRGT